MVTSAYPVAFFTHFNSAKRTRWTFKEEAIGLEWVASASDGFCRGSDWRNDVERHLSTAAAKTINSRRGFLVVCREEIWRQSL